jgi:clan AA aspartic protease (TIGR02281 family)
MSRPQGGIARVLALAWALVWAVGGSPAAQAEIYQWTDASGRLHFSQDLSQVPAAKREQAIQAASAPKARDPLQVYSSGGGGAAAPAPRAASRRSGGTMRIPFKRQGTLMRVDVLLNDRVKAPFLIDTGASDVSMPAWVARELGLDLESARTHYYRTANGVVQNRVVMLDSVDLGGARVENVPASISKSMSIGLLGLSYFNHFEYQIDPAAGIVTLRENGEVESGRLRGGRREGQWRREFETLAQRREAIEAAIDEVGSNRARRKQELREAIDEVERQLEVLEAEADEARVPMRWRD